MTLPRLALFAALLLMGGGLRTSPCAADDPKPEAPKKDDVPKKEEAPPTAAAEKGPFTVVLEGSGAFEAIHATEVSYEPDAYGGELKVVEARAAGPVEKGDLLVRFDTEKIDEQLSFAEKDLEIARRALAGRREEAKRASEGAALALSRAEKDRSAADEALDYFTKVSREQRVKESDHRLQGTRDNIQDQEEELAQLKKMYKSDDVVEETEEIVMKRAQRGLARSKTVLGFQEQNYKEMVEQELPREQQNLELSARRLAFELDRMKATSPIALEQGRIDLAKAELAFERQEASFGKLKADKEHLTIAAPAGGLAIPGSLVRGKWGGIDETTRSLVPGEKVHAKQAIYTIVTPGAVAFRTSVPEASVLSVKAGQAVEIACTAFPDGPTVKGKVARIARASTDGAYEVNVDVSGANEAIVPGFSGKSKIVTAEKPDAITIPAGSVVVDGEKKVVHLWADGKASPKTVKVGATSGGRTEVLEGIAAGDKVLTSPPKP